MRLFAPARAAVLFALTIGVSGCLQLPEDQPTGEGEPVQASGLFAIISTVSRPVGDPLPQAPIAGGDILVKGPTGYCVDGESLTNRASGGFALLASCHVMTGGKSGPNVAPVVMTVSASKFEGGETVPDRANLASAFAPAPVLSGTEVRGLSMVHLATGGEKAVPDADPRHWRGAMALNGYLVSLAVYGPRGSFVSNAGGSALLVELAQSLRQARPAPPPDPAPEAGPAPAGAVDSGNKPAENDGEAPGGRILGGLFQ